MLSLSLSSPFLIPRSPAHEGMHHVRQADFANLTNCLHQIYPHKLVLQINAPTCTVTNNKNPHIPGGFMSGPEGTRTPDLLSAIEARSQLRYRPSFLEARTLYLMEIGLSRRRLNFGVLKPRFSFSLL